MKKLVFILSVLLLMIGAADVQAQWLKKVGQKAVERAKDRAKNKVERKVDDAVDKTVDGAFDGAEDAVKRKDKKEKTNDSAEDVDGQTATQDSGQQQQQKGQSLEMTYAKSDFVPGDEIIFDDNVENEQIGEFPSQWDALHGTIEIAQLNGQKVILAVSDDDPSIAPLFNDMKNYLPTEFTLELDFWVGAYTKKDGKDDNPCNRYIIYFKAPESGSRVQSIDIDDWFSNSSNHNSRLSWSYQPTSGDGYRNGKDDSFRCNVNAWNHFALSFNKRAMKIYINGVRYANIPNTIAPGNFEIQFYRSGGYFLNNASIKNIRIAKGAVPLYDRMMTEGRFITYGITFDVGKSTIKPESMGEINRIVKLMADNPDLKFSVEGHTDSTGNATTNQALSEARSKAIVDKLVELGIATDRLTSSGKGQTTPIADNGTDEGRAKNRRVEFVKI